MKMVYYCGMAQFNHLELNAQIARSGRSQNDVAAVMGVHYNTISNWVRGKAEPRPTQLLDLLIHLGVDVSSIRLVDYWPCGE
jgi:transcriptional regulator with XRE-family HTH domain